MDIGTFLGLAAGAGIGGLSMWWHGRGTQRAAPPAGADTAPESGARVMRVWVAELRAITLTLQGHAEQCAAHCPQAPLHAGIAAALRQLVALGDDLQDQLVATGGPPALCPEAVPLAAAVEDAVAAVATSLAPARRQWRVAPALHGVTLRVDRRALMEVLQRVLGNAARHSRAGDWIELRPESRHDGLALVVEDEGTGLCAPARPALPGSPENRGLGLGLALARRLMEAHGGSLTVQAVARVGTQVTLLFPPPCVVAAAVPATQAA